MSEDERKPASDGSPEDQGRARGGIERRRHARYGYSSHVFVRVILVEETHSPSLLVAHTRNICSGGMMVEVENLPEHLYRRLICRQRPVRINAQIPGTEGQTVFFGKVAWHDYQETSRGTSCLMGTEFEQLRGEAQQALSGLLVRLHREATTMPQRDMNC